MNFKKNLVLTSLLTIASSQIVNTVTNEKILSKQDEIEEKIIKGINKASYQISPWDGTTVESFKIMIDSNFIKNQLWDELQHKFKAELYALNTITVNNREITNDDLATVGEFDAVINYDYGWYQNQTTNLKVNVIAIPEITAEQFKTFVKERSAHAPMIFTIKTYNGPNDYLPEVLETMAQAIINEFLNVYKLKVDRTKLKMEKIENIRMTPPAIANEWFKNKKRFNAFGSCAYDGLSTGIVRMVFKVVDSNKN